MALATVIMCCMWATPATAQAQPNYAPEQLDRMVSRVALYPDPLLAQVLAAATFPNDIPDAAAWADEHHNLNGGQLAAAIEGDQLPWDPSVQALLPFPNVLHMMASDMPWTTDVGDAFLGQQQEVMYAVQRMRQRARDYGYLRSGPQIVVAGGPYITIMPARPDYIVVPTYDPVVVYARPRPGFFVGAAIGFRFGVGVGVAFRPWGWGNNRIAWDRRVVFINNAPWQRTWVNRHEYHHPYTVHYYPEHHYVRGHENHGHEVAYRAHERNEIRHEEHARAESHDHGRDYRPHENHGPEVHKPETHGNGNNGNHGNGNNGNGNHGHDDKGHGDKGHGAKDDHGDHHR
ncbi:MAG TPA: DUF3300 domain-containing protein [Candidatus Angelobacter sp.]|jgi:hypothetical protein|nr:DUF3300 domain-containing protein [Candidatus Angelobacter sp.]